MSPRHAEGTSVTVPWSQVDVQHLPVKTEVKTAVRMVHLAEGRPAMGPPLADKGAVTFWRAELYSEGQPVWTCPHRHRRWELAARCSQIARQRKLNEGVADA